MEVRTYTYDGEEYILVNQIKKDNIKYLYLAKEDGSDPHFRKIDSNEPDMIAPLDSEEEFDFVVNLFLEKLHKNNDQEENNS